MKAESFEANIETHKTPEFDWREWVADADEISEEAARILDELTELTNTTDDGEQFRKDVYDMTNKLQGQALLSLSGYFRDVLTPEERTLVANEVQRVGRKIPFDRFE